VQLQACTGFWLAADSGPRRMAHPVAAVSVLLTAQ